MSLKLTADSIEQTKRAIINWLDQQAHDHRVKASLAVLVRTRKEEIIKANTYEEAANFLSKADIVPTIIH